MPSFDLARVSSVTGRETPDARSWVSTYVPLPGPAIPPGRPMRVPAGATGSGEASDSFLGPPGGSRSSGPRRRSHCARSERPRQRPWRSDETRAPDERDPPIGPVGCGDLNRACERRPWGLAPVRRAPDIPATSVARSRARRHCFCPRARAFRPAPGGGETAHVSWKQPRRARCSPSLVVLRCSSAAESGATRSNAEGPLTLTQGRTELRGSGQVTDQLRYNAQYDALFWTDG